MGRQGWGFSNRPLNYLGEAGCAGGQNVLMASEDADIDGSGRGDGVWGGMGVGVGGWSGGGGEGEVDEQGGAKWISFDRGANCSVMEYGAGGWAGYRWTCPSESLLRLTVWANVAGT